MRQLIFVLCAFSILKSGYSKQFDEYHIREITDVVYVDTNNNITSPDQLKQTKNLPSLPNYGEENAAYWLHFSVPSYNQKWVVEAYNFKTDELALFYKENGEWKQKQVGWKYPYNKRDYDLLNLVIDVPVANQNDNGYFLKVYAKDGPGFTIFLRDQRRFTNYAINENAYLAFFYGILVIVAIYNFILFLYLKERNHLFLSIYIISCIFYSFLSNGFGYKYLWPYHPGWNVWIDYLWTPLLFTGSYALYALDFIKIRTTYPILFKALVSLVILSLSLIVFEYFLPFNVTFLANIYLIPLVSIFGASIYTYLQGDKYNRFFILGNSIVLLSILMTIVADNTALNLGIVGVYGFDFAICAEIIILSLALADKILFLKKENDQSRESLISQLEQNQALQQKVNLELEKKVKERTVLLTEKTEELIEANKELKLKTDQLNEINSKLDYDNWKLNKSIESETLARLKGKEVSFDEFKRVFPDDLSCLRFLRDLKWKENYKCIKCGHEKYKEVDKLYARKCSKCGHIQSVSSNTLLHRIRFSPLKAFYISYCIYYKVVVVNEQLSALVDLPENTCWRYQKKLKDYGPVDYKTWEGFLLLDKR